MGTHILLKVRCKNFWGDKFPEKPEYESYLILKSRILEAWPLDRNSWQKARIQVDMGIWGHWENSKANSQTAWVSVYNEFEELVKQLTE